MARTAQEAKRMWEAAEKAGMKAMVAFNYRFVPAIRLARDLIASGGLGKLYHYRAAYLQDWLMPQFRLAKVWRMRKELAGSGVLGDLGSHIIDLGHFLVGSKIKSVSALQKTFIEERQLEVDGSRIKVEVDDAFAAVVEFENGVLGTLESTRLAGGDKNHNALEINGEKGSIRWNLERLNELQVYWAEEQPGNTRGFHEVLVTGKEHPWINYWWPPGHILGWEHTFVHEIAHLLDCIVNDKPIGPFGATFEDGYRACVVVDAMLESAKTGKQIDCLY
jgi:predicted dehydrogenase